MNWHCLSIDKAFEMTSSDKFGLTDAEASIRRSKYGLNELTGKKKTPAWVLFLNQFKDFMILILIAAAIISGIISDITDTIIIVVIIILNAIIGFVQEYRAQKALEALKKMAALHSEVLRDGNAVTIPATELVPGDIVLLEAGNAVPADIRLVETHSIRIDESALTGESVASDKISDLLNEPDLPLGDRLNMAYKGTVITNGRGKGLVVATGMETEIGKIARMLEEESGDTPLQKRLTEFGKKLSYIILFICLILFGTGLLRGEEPMNMLLLSISLAVAAIPEALPALVTIALAGGAHRLVKKNALIRKLPAVETLGSVTFICSDKTGTLTMNKMVVEKIMEPSTPQVLINNVSALLTGMVLNHDIKSAGDAQVKGDPTEVALYQYGLKTLGHSDYSSIINSYPRVAELPFDSDRKCMTTVHTYGEAFLVLSKGAAESIVSNLSRDEAISYITDKNDLWSADGLRVIAFGYKIIDHLPIPFSYETIESNLSFAGLAGMIDPVRDEVKAAIDECKTAGIIPVMITGDHPATAAAIAKQLDILSETGQVISGKELQELSSDQLLDIVEKVSVYARVTPEQKLTIVRALQKKNHFVAMTGDGVNDAPSLKAADIGIAMGITGTDVSKEVSDMILLDDNFATIVKAVKEGRRIYDNIRKFVKYIMTCNNAEILTIFMAPLLGLPIPLLPIHILWINLVTDGLPGLALAGERSEKDIMKRAPRKTDESLFAGGTGYHIIWVGVLMAGITLIVQAFSIVNNLHWQTMVFTVLSLSQLGHVLAIRSDNEFLYQKGIFSNMPLLGAVLITLILQMLVIYLPVANDIFKTVPLTLYELMVCFGMSAIVFHAVELEKWVKWKSGKLS